MYRVFDDECVDKLLDDFEDAEEYAMLNACAVADMNGEIIEDFREE